MGNSLIIAVMLFVALALLISYRATRNYENKKAEQKRYAHMQVRYYDGCMGDETRQLCPCGSQRVTSEPFSPYWLASENQCDLCKKAIELEENNRA